MRIIKNAKVGTRFFSIRFKDADGMHQTSGSGSIIYLMLASNTLLLGVLMEITSVPGTFAHLVGRVCFGSSLLMVLVWIHGLVTRRSR